MKTTKMETQLLNAIKTSHWLGEMGWAPSDEVCDESGLPTQSRGGVMSSLIKKGLVEENTFGEGEVWVRPMPTEVQP